MTTDLSHAGPALFKALAVYQADPTMPVKGSSNPHFRSRYADLAEVLTTALPRLAACGLSLTQHVGGAAGTIEITSVLAHESGEYMTSQVSMPADKPGPQALGSIVTYLRRYSAQAILGLAGVDDDGEAAEGRAPAARTEPTQAPPAETAPLLARVRELRTQIGWSGPQLVAVLGNVCPGVDSPMKASTVQLGALIQHMETVLASNKSATE